MTTLKRLFGPLVHVNVLAMQPAEKSVIRLVIESSFAGTVRDFIGQLLEERQTGGCSV